MERGRKPSLQRPTVRGTSREAALDPCDAAALAARSRVKSRLSRCGPKDPKGTHGLQSPAGPGRALRNPGETPGEPERRASLSIRKRRYF